MGTAEKLVVFTIREPRQEVVLETKCHDAIPGDGVTEAVIEGLLATARSQRNPKALGLAAPQIGVSIRACVVYYLGTWMPMLNPLITRHSDRVASRIEGCLSLPGRRVPVTRWQKVDVMWTKPDGMRVEMPFSGQEARIVQHEIDHLKGLLIRDRRAEPVTTD
jgi:peptide deformylase